MVMHDSLSCKSILNELLQNRATSRTGINGHGFFSYSPTWNTTPSQEGLLMLTPPLVGLQESWITMP